MPDLAPMYRPLGASARPFTTQLFGDDLSKEIKELKDTHSIGLKSYGGHKPVKKFGNDGGRGRGSRGRGGYSGGRGAYGYKDKAFRKGAPPQQQPGRGQHAAKKPDAGGQHTVSKSPLLPFKWAQLQNKVENFKAGKIAKFVDNWAKISRDNEILTWVQGVHIDFDQECSQTYPPKPLKFEGEEKEAIQAQIDKMKQKGIIEETRHEAGEFISNIFCRPKKDGSVRIILNLKTLNKQVEYHHFKMETLTHAIQLMTKGCYMASIDLKDAYYSVPIAQEDRKYLKFQWQGHLYQFTCLPNGLAEAPRKFTKLLKVPFAVLRSQGHESSAYLDDSALFGGTEKKCLENVQDSMSFRQSRVTVHPEKSMLTPQHILIYLGFILNSLEMTVTPTPEKIQKVIDMCEQLLNKKKVMILELAEVVGTLIALEPGMELAPVFYRRLDIFKADALKLKRGNLRPRFI